MTHPDSRLVTPIFLKTGEDMPWPEDERAFYVLSSDGLFLCRNHPWFHSSVPAPGWPSELAPHHSFLRLRYPRVPRKLFETIVGFFEGIARRFGSEAAVLLAWDPAARRVRPVVPRQVATVSRSYWGDVTPIGLRYDHSADLPPGWTILGDVHSHVGGPAYASATDKEDEAHRAGLHIVVGRIYREPPDIFVAVVVDGTRFTLDPGQVIEGYEARRRRTPPSWVAKVHVEPESSRWNSAPAWGFNLGPGTARVSLDPLPPSPEPPRDSGSTTDGAAVSKPENGYHSQTGDVP